MEDSIVVTRTLIHDILEEDVFKNKGGGMFTSLNKYDVEKAFDLYDEYFFNGEIRDRLIDTASTIDFVVIKNSKRTEDSVGVVFDSGIPEYYISISPSYVDQFRKIQDSDDIDRIHALQITLEHDIIHLLMMMWEYLDRVPNNPIYSSHGKLYKCVLKTYFGHTVFDHNIGMERSPTPKKSGMTPPKKTGLLRNWENSCYLDSLLMSIFLGASNFPRHVIFETKIKNVDYSPDNYHVGICHSESTIKSQGEFYDFAQRFQNALKSDYNSITHSQASLKCVNLRGIIAECIPTIRGKDMYEPFSPTDIYEILTRVFPGLKIQNIPTTVITPPTEKMIRDGITISQTKRVNSRPTPMYQMWDYMNPVGEEGSYPDWERCEFPILVFQSGMIPPIRNYGSKEPEEIVSYGAIPGKFQRVKEIRRGVEEYVNVPEYGQIKILQHKARSFGEYIISGRYRLFAVVRSIGIAPMMGAEEISAGGGHYSAYIRPSSDPETWYLYDDIQPTWEKLPAGKLPKNTFINEEYARSEMLFYQKLKSKSPGKK